MMDTITPVTKALNPDDPPGFNPGPWPQVGMHTDVTSVQQFADGFCTCIREGKLSDVKRYIQLAEHLVTTMEHLHHIFTVHFISDIFPLLDQYSTEQEQLTQTLPAKLRTLYGYYSILENHWFF